MSRGAQRDTKRCFPANGGVGILSSGAAPLLDVLRDELQEEDGTKRRSQWKTVALLFMKRLCGSLKVFK